MGKVIFFSINLCKIGLWKSSSEGGGFLWKQFICEIREEEKNMPNCYLVPEFSTILTFISTKHNCSKMSHSYWRAFNFKRWVFTKAIMELRIDNEYWTKKPVLNLCLNFYQRNFIWILVHYSMPLLQSAQSTLAHQRSLFQWGLYNQPVWINI